MKPREAKGGVLPSLDFRPLPLSSIRFAKPDVRGSHSAEFIAP
jgi:hypothetical protein